MNCRFCGESLSNTFVNLGATPLSNSYLTREQLNKGEIIYPLHVYVCDSCKLVQLEEFESPKNIFNNEYAYFSSYSATWLEHCEDYSRKVINRFNLDKQKLVIEIASNDGYLLKNFYNLDIPCIGIEPTANTAQVAINTGIPTIVEFFGVSLANSLCRQEKKADLIIGNNVFAHVPDINDFTLGLKILLTETGVITLEFPHILELIKNTQFDTIYHEHFSYFSFFTVEKIMAAHGLEVFDVERLPTHGGSLRLYIQHSGGHHTRSGSVKQLRDVEKEFGLHDLETYSGFSERIEKLKYGLLTFLIDAKEKNLTVAAYGAPAKGNTLLNYCGIKPDLINFTVDANPVKQNRFLPGSRIPILGPEKIKDLKPDIVLILPWNLSEEISEKHGYISEWGGRFVVPVPEVRDIK